MGAFQGPKDWGRLLTAMLTPFRSDGSVNEAEAARIAVHLVDQEKNDGLVISGTTGESPTLTETEKLRLLEVVLEAVGDRAAVLFGAGTYDTQDSVEMAAKAEAAGAHGIMVVNPYYSKPGQRGLDAHFRAVASATGLPVLLYNIMPRSSINLETDTLLRLAEVPNIVGVKEASGNMGQITEVCAKKPDGFRVYSGDDGLTLPILSVGGHGVVSVAGHVVGAQIADMVRAFFRNEIDHSRAVHHALLESYRILFKFPSPTPVKYALSLRGFDCERVRLPLVELTEAERREVRDTLGAVLVEVSAMA